MITRAWYGLWFPRLKSRIEDREWTLPRDDYIIGDFGVVRMKAGYPLIEETTKERKGEAGLSKKRHGDGAAAAALSLHAIEECSEDTPPYAEVTESGNADIWTGYGG
jgi:phage FluMu gp28-like protein